MKLTFLLAILGVAVQGLDITVENSVSVVEDTSSVTLEDATEGAHYVKIKGSRSVRTKEEPGTAGVRALKKKKSPPTAAPVPEPCFPGDAIVEVEGEGQVRMRDVKIGDRVLGMGGKFQPIYAFGHRSIDTPSHYIRFYTNGTSAPFEAAPRHYVFLHDQQKVPAVPAFLKVGDVLLGADANGAALEITKIETISKNGFYAPVTSDGTIVVNGVVASSYSFPHSYSIEDPNDYVYFLGKHKIMSIHAFSHVRNSPLRLVSFGISPWFGTLADKEGRNYLSSAYKYAGTWMHSSDRGYVVVAVGTVLFYALCGSAWFSYLIECLVGPVMGPTVIALVILAFMVAFKKQGQTNKAANGIMKVKIH